MGDVVRMPALAEVLAVVCSDTHCAGWWRAEIAAGLRVECGDRGASTPTATVPWAHATPADTLAALVEAELLPEQWCDPERGPRWWCERCAGVGRVTLRSIDGSGDLGSYAVMPDARGDLRCDAFDVSGAPPCGAPPSHPALVAVASLGVDTLARAEAIVAETWRARVVWRVLEAAEYGEARIGLTLRGDASERSRAAHVALWDLNIYPLAIDDGRVTLAVEALL